MQQLEKYGFSFINKILSYFKVKKGWINVYEYINLKKFDKSEEEE